METNPENYERIKGLVQEQNQAIAGSNSSDSLIRYYSKNTFCLNNADANFLITLIEKQRAELEEAKALIKDADLIIILINDSSEPVSIIEDWNNKIESFLKQS